MPTRTDELVRILVVDDDEVDRMTIRRHLESLDVVIDELEDATDIVDRVRAGAYGCIILDHALPRETGLDVLARLRGAGLETPVLAITGADEAVGAALVAAGATDFLPKSDLTPLRLAGRLRHVQRLARAEQAANRARLDAERNRALLHSMLRTLPTGVAVVGAGGEVVLTNPAAEVVLGPSAIALADGHLELGREARALVKQSLATGEPTTGEAPLVHSGRRYRVAVTPIEDGDGRPAATAVVTLDDVTDELAAIETAERAARFRADIVAIVSHDLRGPLNSIGVAMDALKDDAISGDERARFSAAVMRSIERADRMITDLTTAGQIEAGTLRVERATVKVRALLEQARRDHELVASKSKMAIVLGTVDDGEVQADRDRLLQALGNLVQNALRHAKGTPEIVLSAVRSPAEVALVVSDHGPGIAADALPHLFDRYWQGRERRGGAGLGLSIVRGIARAHGGDARAAPAAGGGAEFTIVLPAG
jgi:signal transduction histidine kinase/CheY-like chemotaxis protein